MNPLPPTEQATRPHEPASVRDTEGGKSGIVVRVRGLVNRFGAQVVHRNLDLDIRRGEILGLVGGSGSGKSVLLRSIIGLQKFESGTVEVFGQNINRLSPEEAERLRRRWGVLFQDGALFSALRVGENVEVPLREFYRLPARMRCELACMKLAMVGLDSDVMCKYPAELSGGMRRRAGLARALASDPELLFLDEPTSGLDPISAARFDSLIQHLARALGLTVMLVTHDLDTLFTVCDRIAVLADGRVIVAGSLNEVLACDHPWVREYFHGPRAHLALASHARTATGDDAPDREG
ncbi:MAG: ATP-binding cassette domain-containing protein [Alphaproteobacteria bacterium]|nr:MAG: ATP-binding cassette domain-containing protein [Alphaproteobacteria bacterium]